MTAAKIAAEFSGAPMLLFVVAAAPFGYEQHFAVECKETSPGVDASSVEDMEQRCFPSRRQHAGSVPSEPANASGAISGKLNRVSRNDASARRILFRGLILH